MFIFKQACIVAFAYRKSRWECQSRAWRARARRRRGSTFGASAPCAAPASCACSRAAVGSSPASSCASSCTTRRRPTPPRHPPHKSIFKHNKTKQIELCAHIQTITNQIIPVRLVGSTCWCQRPRRDWRPLGCPLGRRRPLADRWWPSRICVHRRTSSAASWS